MSKLARVCAAAIIAILPLCSAQTPQHKKKAPPKPEPTAQDLFAYIRGGLLSFSPDDGINDNLEVTLDPTGKILTVKQPDGHCDQFLSALDGNTIAGQTARTCYDNRNTIDAKVAANRARFLFSFALTDRVPGFQAQMTKVFKKLIMLSGGAPEKDIF